MTKIASSFDPSSELSFFFHPSGSKIGRSGAGILAALVYACQLQLAYLFDQAGPMVAFHFQPALFMYCSLMCWERASKKCVVLFVIIGLMVPSVRHHSHLNSTGFVKKNVNLINSPLRTGRSNHILKIKIFK